MVNDDTEMLQSVLAYNLMVIKALWKSKWGNFGESTINVPLYRKRKRNHKSIYTMSI